MAELCNGYYGNDAEFMEFELLVDIEEESENWFVDNNVESDDHGERAKLMVQINHAVKTNGFRELLSSYAEGILAVDDYKKWREIVLYVHFTCDPLRCKAITDQKIRIMSICAQQAKYGFDGHNAIYADPENVANEQELLYLYEFNQLLNTLEWMMPCDQWILPRKKGGGGAGKVQGMINLLLSVQSGDLRNVPLKGDNFPYRRRADLVKRRLPCKKTTEVNFADDSESPLSPAHVSPIKRHKRTVSDMTAGSSADDNDKGGFTIDPRHYQACVSWEELALEEHKFVVYNQNREREGLAGGGSDDEDSDYDDDDCRDNDAGDQGSNGSCGFSEVLLSECGIGSVEEEKEEEVKGEKPGEKGEGESKQLRGQHEESACPFFEEVPDSPLPLSANEGNTPTEDENGNCSLSLDCIVQALEAVHLEKPAEQESAATAATTAETSTEVQGSRVPADYPDVLTTRPVADAHVYSATAADQQITVDAADPTHLSSSTSSTEERHFNVQGPVKTVTDSTPNRNPNLAPDAKSAFASTVNASLHLQATVTEVGRGVPENYGCALPEEQRTPSGTERSERSAAETASATPTPANTPTTAEVVETVICGSAGKNACKLRF